MKNNKTLRILLILIFSIMNLAYSNTQHSTQPHELQVNSVQVSNTNDSRYVYSGSDDGFLIRWDENGIGEHLQVSDESIKLIAIHPNGIDIAIYESDGFALNRLSVWNWQTKTKRFSSKRFESTITSLQYSTKGSYLMVGQANVNGIIFLDSSTGKVLTNKISENVGSVSFAQTSKSEESSVMYSNLGYLVYTNLIDGSRKAAFSVENKLENSVIFNNDVLFAGTKNNKIYLFGSTTGELLAQINSINPLLVTNRSDKNLYYIEASGRDYSLRMIEVNDGIINTSPIILKMFNFNQRDKVISAAKYGTTIFVGMESGELYSLSTNPSSSTVAATKISEKVYDKILDIAEYNDGFFFLTSEAIFKSSYSDNTVHKILENNSYTNMDILGQNILLWSTKSRKYVKSISIVDNTQTDLFYPANTIENLKVQSNMIIYIEGSSKVLMYDFASKENSTIYTGTGIEDALLYQDTKLFVVKTAASNPKSSLIEVNTQTKETLPISIDGDVSFSLTHSNIVDGPIYGASIITENDKVYTKIFSYIPSSSTHSILLSLADEDPKAFIHLNNNSLYTNIGRSQVFSIDLVRKNMVRIQQSASLPVKIITYSENGLLLNKDGSISWINLSTNSITENWYFTVNETWLEF